MEVNNLTLPVFVKFFTTVAGSVFFDGFSQRQWLQDTRLSVLLVKRIGIVGSRADNADGVCVLNLQALLMSGRCWLIRYNKLGLVDFLLFKPGFQIQKLLILFYFGIQGWLGNAQYFCRFRDVPLLL